VTRLVGYARELMPGAGTTAEVNLLEAAGAVRVFTDARAEGTKTRRGGWIASGSWSRVTFSLSRVPYMRLPELHSS
jgi:hypothetical protein